MSAQKSSNADLLASWISPEYVNDYRNGTLRRYWSEAPFGYVALPNFFDESFLAEMESSLEQVTLEKSPDIGEAMFSELEWGAFRNPVVIKKLFSRPFMDFLTDLLGEEVLMSARAIPQYNHFPKNSKGMLVHNDDNEANGRHIVSLVQLTQGWHPGRGGELLLHGSDPEFKVERTIPPIRNTFIAFKISPTSWHSVSDMNGDWERKLLVFDWYLRSRLHENS